MCTNESSFFLFFLFFVVYLLLIEGLFKALSISNVSFLFQNKALLKFQDRFKQLSTT